MEKDLEQNNPNVVDIQQEYFVGSVSEVSQQVELASDPAAYIQTLLVRSDSGQEYTVQLGDEFQPVSDSQLRETGDRVVLVSQTGVVPETQIQIADSYRLPTVVGLSVLFAAIVILVGRTKGFLSLLGMIASFAVLLQFIIPQILAGANPILISLFGSLLIGSATIYLSHGYSKKSHIALGSMMLSLLFVSVVSFFAVESAALFGLGSEEAAFLQVGSTANINLQGLLLGGIMLGALGVLDDITISQVAIVFQLKATKPKISFKELYDRALSVGRDHVASLVNTLVLAYAGANMPLFILFSITEVPTWVTLNSEIIVEEIIRTVLGSMGLVLAVPLTTIVAVYFAQRLSKKELEALEGESHGHTH